MIRLCAAVLVVLAGPAHSNTLVGSWTCVEVSKTAQVNSELSFTKAGKFKAHMELFFKDDAGRVVAQANVRYRSRYKVVGDFLHDHPISAQIRSFTAYGRDIRNGDESRSLKASLLQDTGDTAKIRFDSPTQLVLSKSSGGEIRCVPAKGAAPTS